MEGPNLTSQYQMTRPFHICAYLLLHSEQYHFSLFHIKVFSTSLIVLVIPPWSLGFNLTENLIMRSETRLNYLGVHVFIP